MSSEAINVFPSQNAISPSSRNILSENSPPHSFLPLQCFPNHEGVQSTGERISISYVFRRSEISNDKVHNIRCIKIYGIKVCDYVPVLSVRIGPALL